MTNFKLKSLHDGSEIRLDKDFFTIGRETDCDVVLSQGFPSRVHAQIILKNGQLILDDLESTNGTFVNDQRIVSSTPIKTGDLLKFATTEFRLVDENESDQTIIAAKANASSKAGSYFVVEEESDSDQTGLRQHYPLPAGWPVENTQMRAAFFSPNNSEQDTKAKKIDRLIEKTLTDKDDIFVAALIFQAEDMAPIIYGISLDSEAIKWTIGRGDKCDFTVKLPSISEVHAELVFMKNKWRLIDNKSTNGMRVDSELKSEIDLKPNMQVSLGSVDMTFKEVHWNL